MWQEFSEGDGAGDAARHRPKESVIGEGAREARIGLNMVMKRKSQRVFSGSGVAAVVKVPREREREGMLTMATAEEQLGRASRRPPRAGGVAHDSGTEACAAALLQGLEPRRPA